MGNSRSTVIGFALLFLLWMGYVWVNSPSQAEIEAAAQEKKRLDDSTALADSLQLVQAQAMQAAKAQASSKKDEILADSSLSQTEKDSLIAQLPTAPQASSLEKELFGPFAAAASCQGELQTLENDKIKVTFNTKGGRIVDVELKEFKGYDHETADSRDKKALHLLNNAKDRFSYFIPLANVGKGGIETQDLCFQAEAKGNVLVFRAYAANDKEFIEQRYEIGESGYLLNYDFALQGLDRYIPKTANSIPFSWQSNLNKIEKNPSYERRMSSIHFKEVESSPSYCTCGSDAEETLEKDVQWVSHAQQFFNSSLIIDGSNKPKSGQLQTFMMPDDSAHLKSLTTRLNFPLANANNLVYNMRIYLGPNDYDGLSSIDVGLERIIPFGWSIFGFISRHVIRPLFNFLASFIPSYGLIIIILTLLIRGLMFPLQYKMLKSSVKMSILRPQLSKLKEKYKDDAQGMQMEQMKIYQQYGVSPLGGCLPMVLTMPIWIALYRFFPASIEFRQKSFLWADDLVSYDSIFDFGYIPVIYDFYGDHVSLFTLLWCVSMFAYLTYNGRQQMDMMADNPNAKMMKYMQYAFPVIFFFALNSWAAGLTCYMLFSNLFNIGQTFLVKSVLLDKDKLAAEMEQQRQDREANPKKKSGWQARYQEMMEQQRQMLEEQKKNKKKK